MLNKTLVNFKQRFLITNLLHNNIFKKCLINVSIIGIINKHLGS